MPESDRTAISPDDLATIEEAIYTESFRTLDEQAKVLEGLRARAGTLVGLVTVATAFVGGLALSGHSVVKVVAGQSTTHPSLGGAAWLAIALYVGVIFLSFLTYIPSRNWVFGHDAHGLLATYVDPGPPVPLSEFRRTITYYNGLHHKVNGRRLTRVSTLLALASVCFVTEIVLWLWILAT